LAAGKQTRFRGPHLKCMSEVGGKPVLEHLARQVVSPAVIVTGDMWNDAELACAKSYGLRVERIKTGTIGQSVAAGLLCLRKHGFTCDSVYVLGADVFCIGELPLPQDNIEMLFDPTEHITIWRLSGSLLNPNLYPSVTDRVEFAEDLHMLVNLVRHPWVNVNNIEALTRARGLWHEHSRIESQS
jgi:bifunctional N-acetylglucosamine-1-phosphate-uridyltransferase/glucosamine-1-phosphate-acetyltransferase GlmU-like protein